MPSNTALSKSPKVMPQKDESSTWIYTYSEAIDFVAKQASILTKIIHIFKKGYTSFFMPLRVFTSVIKSIFGGNSWNINFKFEIKDTSICIFNVLLTFKKELHVFKYMKKSNPSNPNYAIVSKKWPNRTTFNYTVKFRILTSAVFWLRNYIVWSVLTLWK